MVKWCAAKDRRPAGNSNRLCMFTKLDLKSFGRHLGMLGRVELMGWDGLDCGETCKIMPCGLGFWQQYCASCVRCIVSACVSLAIVMWVVCNVGLVEWKIKTLANWVYLSWSKQAIKHIDCYHSVSFHYYTMILTDVSWSPCQMR